MSNTTGPRQPFVDYEPWTRKLEHELEPGMVVRPRTAKGTRMDMKRWVVERVSGAVTRCKCGRISQYWATDSMIPVKFKRSARTAADQLAAGAEKHIRKGRTDARPADDLALALKECQGLDALIAYAAGLGYPECDTLAGKIAHLNPGLQRMNVGNRLRAWAGKTTGKGN